MVPAKQNTTLSLSLTECLALAEAKLCQNQDVVYEFQCEFPGNADDMNRLESFTYTELLQVFVTVLVFCMSLVGNSAVLIIINSKPSLRTAMDLFLVNLSIADLFISVVCLVDNLLRSLSYTYLLGPIGCKAGSYIHMICLFVSVLTLVGIAIDRGYAVLFPLKTLQSSVRLRAFVVGIIWIISALLATPFFILKEYRVYKWTDFTEAQCTYTRGIGYYDHSQDTAHSRCTHGYNYTYIYHVMVTIMMFFVPVAVIVVAYSLIVGRLWKSRVIGEVSADHQSRTKTKRRIVRLALVVLSGFLICWTPLQILIIISLMGYMKSQAVTGDRVEFWIYLLAYSNSALNPMIYGGFNKTYRKEFLSLLRGKRHNQLSISKGGIRKGISGPNRTSSVPRTKTANIAGTSFTVDVPVCPLSPEGLRTDQLEHSQANGVNSLMDDTISVHPMRHDDRYS